MPSPFTTSPDAEDSGTDFVKVTDQLLGEADSSAPFLGSLSTKVLWANALPTIMNDMATTAIKMIANRDFA